MLRSQLMLSRSCQMARFIRSTLPVNITLLLPRSFDEEEDAAPLPPDAAAAEGGGPLDAADRPLLVSTSAMRVFIDATLPPEEHREEGEKQLEAQR